MKITGSCVGKNHIWYCQQITPSETVWKSCEDFWIDLLNDVDYRLRNLKNISLQELVTLSWRFGTLAWHLVK